MWEQDRSSGHTIRSIHTGRDANNRAKLSSILSLSYEFEHLYQTIQTLKEKCAYYESFTIIHQV